MVSADLVALVTSLAVALLLAFPLAKSLKAHPLPFYLAALVTVGVYVIAVATGVDLNNVRGLTFVFQKGYLSSILLGIVMFTGCLGSTSVLRRRLRPVRGELSVLSFIFILGHLAVFLPSYAPRLLDGSHLKANVVASIAVALVLGVIFVVLGVTSFKSVRTRMNPRLWKAIQRLSYLMVALYIVHVGFFLGGSALGGSGKGVVSFAVYAVLVLLYAVLRIRKAVCDGRASAHATSHEEAMAEP